MGFECGKSMQLCPELDIRRAHHCRRSMGHTIQYGNGPIKLNWILHAKARHIVMGAMGAQPSATGHVFSIYRFTNNPPPTGGQRITNHMMCIK